VWDQIGGAISACTLTGLGTGNSDTAAFLNVSISRAHASAQSGSLTLDREAGAWKISQFENTLLGPDLGPLVTGTAFCTDLAAAKYADAFALLSSDFQAAEPKSTFISDFTAPTGFRWAGCTPRLDGYKVAGSSASYEADLNITQTSSGRSTSFT